MRRTRHLVAAQIERHHYTTTAHKSVPARSNSAVVVPGSPTGGGMNTALRRDLPDAPNLRAAYGKVSTMANRRNGGGSMYYRQREGWGQ